VEVARRVVDDRTAVDRKDTDRPDAVDIASLTARDLKPVVHLDVDQLRLERRLPPEELARQIDEEMRRVKWPLLAAIAGRGGVAAARNNVIQVTSALPAEGKTFTSLNLALSIARDREMRVILVDGDVARPGLTPTLRLKSHRGLNDVLDDQALDVSEVTYQTSVPGLFFVPAGKWHDQSPEFFAGSRMQQVLEALSQRAGQGVVIFDSPPLLATNEAQVASRYAGQVLLVVRADQTEQRAVLDALALLEKGTPISAVLNRVEASTLSKYYGQYYYGYGYGRNGSDENGQAAR
jgi:receptor protein-tyrosine kinase